MQHEAQEVEHEEDQHEVHEDEDAGRADFIDSSGHGQGQPVEQSCHAGEHQQEGAEEQDDSQHLPPPPEG